MKKNTFITSLALGFSCFFIHFSCEKKETCRFPVYDASFTFRLVDQYGMNQIAKWGSRYLSDSVYITKIDGTPPNQLEIGPDGNISFFIPNDNHEARDSQVTKQFLLYLPDIQGHPKDDTDTITFKYRFNLSCYDQFMVYFNDSLYYNGEYDDFIIFTKN